jgi:hypothetical protein
VGYLSWNNHIPWLYCPCIAVSPCCAKHRDLDETVGHAPNKKIGPLRFPPIPIEDDPVPILSVNGCVVEDRNGVPLVYKVTKVFDKHFKDISVSCNQSPMIIPDSLLTSVYRTVWWRPVWTLATSSGVKENFSVVRKHFPFPLIRRISKRMWNTSSPDTL